MPASRHNVQDGVNKLVSKGSQINVSAQRPAAKKRRGPHILSTLLFLTAIGFAAFAVYLYWNEQENDENEPTPPPAESGEYTLAQVKTALDGTGLSTDFGRTTGDTDQIPGVVGQPVTVGDSEVYAFIFSASDGQGAIAMAGAAFATIDESTITLTWRSGEEIGEGEAKHVFHGSNIIAVMVGGDAADVEKVRSAIEGLN